MSQLKTNIKRGAIIGALSFSLLAGSAIAKGPGGGSHLSLERMTERLDLTDSQALEIEQLIANGFGQRGNQSGAKNEINQLIEQGYVDQAAEQAANAARERVYKMVENKRRLSEILTPEQLAKMEEFKQRKKDRSERFKQRRESEVDS